MIIERLDQGPVIGDGGTLFELERRGYVSAGPFTPEVSVEHPEALLQMHKDYARAGSQVLQAFTYYAHEEKLKDVGKEGVLPEINSAAVSLAREAAEEYGLLTAGNLANTWVYRAGDEAAARETRRQMDRQIEYQAPGGVDFFIAETIEYLGEALVALEAVKAAGLPAMITLGFKDRVSTLDGYTLEDAFRRLEGAGADIVGLNCFRDPGRMMPLLRRVRQAVSCHVAAQPVAFRCSEERPYFQIQEWDGRLAFPLEMDPFYLTRVEMAAYAAEARNLGVNYIGGCCGVAPHHVRAMAEAVGYTAPNSKYSPQLDLHTIIGDKSHIREQDERNLCEQRYGAARCHFLNKDRQD